MTKEELAAALDGTRDAAKSMRRFAAQARADGLVVVFGSSDDLVEFRGAVDDEVGACDGSVVRVDPQGILKSWDALCRDDRDNRDTMRAWFAREGGGTDIKAVWDRGDGTSWSYETDIPHATFNVVEDGRVECIGIVFSLADCRKER